MTNDDTVIWRSKRRERAEAVVTRLRPISPWLLLLAVVVIVAVTWPLTAWLYGIAGNDPARQIEAIKTGLTVAAGTGGFFALLLAFRRQRSTEIIAAEAREARDKEFEQRDRAADSSERDAEQRRITELYTKAADQLGSEKAPVRLAGLHALERLAQNTPEQRQTIVDVICAYLRMPYTPPEEQPPAESAPAEARTRYENRRQELQVRLTAQRILAAHLLPEDADAFWSDISLDLTEAHLYRFSLFACRVRMAHFEGTQFTGLAMFAGTQFEGPAYFARARFGGDAAFDGAQLKGSADFSGARFVGDVDFVTARLGSAAFGGAQFDGKAMFGKASLGSAAFGRARFAGDAYFSQAEFGGDADFSETQFEAVFFDGVQFDGITRFRSAQFDVEGNFHGARFCGRYTAFNRARFGGAQYSGDAGFGETQFSGDTEFGGARFGKDALFRGARFDGAVLFHGALFDRIARFDGAQFDGNSDFDKAKFGWSAVFRGARFGAAADFMEAQFGGAADFTEAQFDEGSNFQGAQARLRHHSWPTGWTSRDARTGQGEQEGWVYLCVSEVEA